MAEVAWLIPVLPLCGFLTLLVAGRRLGDPLAGWLATSAIGASFVLAVATFIDLFGRDAEQRAVTSHLFDWISVGGISIKAALLVDPLSITMVLFVTGIGTLIHLYAIGYMHGDERFSRFFLYLNLFAFSMLVLVLANNYLVAFVGWEGVGVCSYFLISFWFERSSAASAGKKAFVTNRIGDFGFMVAIFLMLSKLGTITYSEVFARAPGLTETAATAICLLLLVGAVGKSAQLPLYVWLPDAMEGPTPVSALIHAATMVTAGVYLMVRSNPLLHMAPDASTVIAWVGVITALFAATAAVAQDDIKRVLAYSTVSQLGYMFLAVGTGAYTAAIFHMVTHAFFKALMFLGAGSVIHGMHHEQNMKRMGGIRKFMPITAATFIVGWLAIAGVPPFAGFWSKDDILLAAWADNKALWAIGVVTAVLTAYYMSRQVFLVFFGKPRWRDEAAESAAADAHGHASAHGAAEPHESPWMMTVPLAVLALLSVLGGAINLPFSGFHNLEHWLEPVVGGHELGVAGGTKIALAVGVVVLAALAIGFARGAFLEHRVSTAALEPVVLREAWYYDAATRAVVAHPGHRLAEGLATVDRVAVDGAVNAVAELVGDAGRGLKKTQSGQVRQYAVGIGLGAVALLAWIVVRVGVGA